MSSLTGGWRAQPAARRNLPSWVGALLEFDLVLVIAAAAMAATGAIMVYSATRSGLRAQGLSTHHWVDRDVLFLAIGAAVLVALAFLDYHRWEALWGAVLGATLLSLLAVMVPHVGKHTLGATRWLPVGPFQFQPSAFAPLALVVVAGAICARSEGHLTWKALAAVVALATITMVIVAKQPDLGSAIVIGVVVAAIVLIGGARARQLVLLAAGVAAAVFLVLHLGLLHGYQMSRFSSFLNQNKGVSGTNYNLAQSKIDIGQGGLFGKGLFRDPQTNLRYVPEQQTDFIFTAVGGQLGFLGTTSVLVLYGLIVQRIWKAATRAPDTFGMLLATGAFALFTFSIFENAGMTMGLTPITGIPLPLMSYGGSADVAFLAAIGIVLNVGRQSRPRSAAVGAVPGAARRSWSGRSMP